MVPKSELEWCLADYKKAGVEPPERILAYPEACEAKLMSEEEVQEHLRDSIGTLLVLLDRNSPRFNDVRKIFIADLECLHRMGKINKDEYNDIRSSEELNL